MFTLVMVTAGVGCTTVQSRVTGQLLVHPLEGKGPPRVFQYEAVESRDIGGTAVGCVFTAIFYGGACWAYLATPYQAHEQLAREHAKEDARRIGGCAEVVGLGRVSRAGWADDPRRVRVTDENGHELTKDELLRLCLVTPGETPL